MRRHRWRYIIEYLKNYVDVKRIEKYCRECPLYGNKWSCPPFYFSPEAIWKKYDKLYIVGKKVYYKNNYKDQTQKMYYDVKHDLTEELFKLEAAHPGSMLFSAGSCDICGLTECSRRYAKPCRFPEKMRHSIESLGGDVVKSAKDLLGIDIQWPSDNSTPEYITTVGGLLYNCSPRQKIVSIKSI